MGETYTKGTYKIMTNVKKNVNLKNLKSFDKHPQPSREAKSAGWERRRQAQAFMDKVMEYQDMSAEEFEKIAKDMQQDKKGFTVRDLMAFRYASKSFNNDKFLIDWINRHISYAPQKTELTGEDGKAIAISTLLDDLDADPKTETKPSK